MVYVPFLIVIAVAIFYFINKRSHIEQLKSNGIRVAGTIIHNSDGKTIDFYRLGGNINTPTVRFITKDGVEVTGQPIISFISEITVPSEVYVIYDPENPQEFSIDLD